MGGMKQIYSRLVSVIIDGVRSGKEQIMRLIDGDKLKRKVQRIATEAWMMKLTASVETTLNQFIDYIDEAPTIEPKRGEWIDRSGGIEGAWNYCSVCGEQAIDLYDFCPNCGADMRKESE